MPRILRVHCPSVRMTPGSSFGPITISATTPMSRNSVQLMSNMKTTLRPRHRPLRRNRRSKLQSAGAISATAITSRERQDLER